jgi:hypothetical protein
MTQAAAPNFPVEDVAMAVVAELERRSLGMLHRVADARQALADADIALIEVQEMMGVVIRPASVSGLPRH